MSPVIDQPRLQEIRKKLKELPKVERVKTYSGPEALEALAKEIRALSRKGYDSKEIAKILKQEGLSASSAKVKKILTSEPQPEADPASDDQPGDDDDDETHKPAEPAINSPESRPRSVIRRPAKPRRKGKEAQL